MHLLKISLFLQQFHFISLSAGDRKVWTDCGTYNDTQTCKCGSDLRHAILCSDDGNSLQIQPCYCMFYDVSEGKTLAGSCMLTCYTVKNRYYRSITRYSVENGSLFNEEMCSSAMNLIDTHREGRFCGRCKEGFGLAVYSYHYTSCIPCTDHGYKNWLKYFAVALLPLTVFYCIVVLLKINVMSSRLCGGVFAIQCLTSPITQRLLDGWESIVDRRSKYQYLKYLNMYLSLLGITNLDFFRGVYPYFCLHPKLNILHVVSLDFLVALYPFFLIFLTYILVSAHDKNCRLLVWAWKPFKWCLEHYQRRFNVKGSLIETFGTFILLSNVKILVICFDILLPTRAYTEEGLQLKEHYLYYDANIKYFGSEHLPFALLALFVGFVLVILPFLLLLLYPCRCFQKLLNSFGCRCQALHIFMDAFQGSYKTEPRDLRYFSAYYLLLRFLILLIATNTATVFAIPSAGFLVAVGAIFFAAFQPYKQSLHNRFDIVAMLVMVLFYGALSSQMIALFLDQHWMKMSGFFFIVVLVFSLIMVPIPLLSFLLSFKKLSFIVFKLCSFVCPRKLENSSTTPLLIHPSDREERS